MTRKTTKRAVAVVVSTLLSLSLLEGGLRAAGYFAERSFWKEVAARATGDPVVLCLGESTTGGLWCDYHDSYPAQLESLLRNKYPHAACVVPPHAGHNSTQMARRIDLYLTAYRPRVVLLMVGANDNWIVDETDESFAWLRALRVTKLATISLSLVGAPTHEEWSPEKIMDAGRVRARWRRNVGSMIRACRAAGASPALMTYPRYRTPTITDCEELAREEAMPLVRNDLDFPDGSDQRLLFGDGDHPRPAGYKLVASNAHVAITRHLGRDVLGWSAGVDPTGERESAGALEIGPVSSR